MKVRVRVTVDEGGMGVDVSPVLPSAAVPYREILVKQREAAAGGTEEEEPLPDYKQFLVLCFGAVALLSKVRCPCATSSP